jgi:hypothetical protein
VTVAVAFKTKNPALIADYFAAREVTASDWRAKVDAFKSSIGYRAEKYGEELPAGWRFDGAKRDVVPAKRTPEGKEIVQTLAGLTLHGDRFPGCPGILFAEGFSVFPRVAKIGDDYFLTLSKVPREEKANALDPDIWEPVKLSEYHAALEAAEMVAS